MNKVILTLLAIGFMATACYASDGCVTVKSNGTYIVGSSGRLMERGSVNCFNNSIPMCKELKTDFNKPIPRPEKPKWNGND